MRGILAVLLIFGLGGTAAAKARKATPRFKAVALPLKGDGYRVPEPWAERGLRFGTQELIGLVKRSAKRVSQWAPGAMLYVADLSTARGGATEWHHSHMTGRDVDLIFFAVDEDGRPASPPTQMSPFDEEGKAYWHFSDGRAARVDFDTARNWALVKALLDDAAQVTHVFIATPLRDLLLAYAEMECEPSDLIARASQVMSQPGDSLPHNDHMHVRIDGPQVYFARAGKAAHRAAHHAAHTRHHQHKVVAKKKHRG